MGYRRGSAWDNTICRVKIIIDTRYKIGIHTVYNILVIEDDTEVAEGIVNYMSMFPGFEVNVESTGSLSAAIVIMKERAFCGVLLDLTLPDVQGVQSYLAVSALTDAPIAIFTGDGSAEMRSALNAAGAHEYYTKPFGMVDAVESLQRAIEYARHERGVA